MRNICVTGKLCILGMLGLWVFSTQVQAQAQIQAERPKGFIPGKVLVNFQEGFLDMQALELEQASYDLAELRTRAISRPTWADSLTKFLEAMKVRKYRKMFEDFKPSYNYSVTRRGDTIPMPKLHNWIILEVSEDQNTPALCKQLSQQKGVIWAEPNYYMSYDEVQTMPNDSLYSLQKSLEQENDIDIDAERAWEINTGAYDVKVGIIDSGIDYTHIDLGKGYGEGNKVRGGFDPFGSDKDPIDEQGHGTAVAGIVGALRNNEQGIAGIAGGDGEDNIGISLYAVRIGDANINAFANIQGVTRAAVNHPEFGLGVNVMNHSYGTANGPGTGLGSAFHLAALNGVVMCASRGNTNQNNDSLPRYPSEFADHLVISVGASDERGQRKTPDFGANWGSNYGSKIDVLAPGDGNEVYTTRRVASAYTPFAGTSASAPHVAGLASLILSYRPDLHPEDVEGIIQASSIDIIEDDRGGDTLVGYDIYSGYGMINAGNALEMLNDPWELSYHTTKGTDKVEDEGFSEMRIRQVIGDEFVPPGLYTGRRLAVYKTVPLPKNFQGTYYAWGRGVGESTGWSKSNDNYQTGFCEVIAQNEKSITLKTYVYVLFGEENGGIGYHPATPVNVEFHYSLLGIPNSETPLSVEITGDNQLQVGEVGEWTANAQGGNGAYEYQWFKRSANTFGLEAIPNSNTPVLRLNMNRDDQFLILSVEVKSGNQTETDDQIVICTNCFQLPDPICINCPEPLIQPNPVQGELVVILKGGDDEVMRTFTLFDPYGNMIRSQQSKAKAFKMDVSNQRMGIYKLVIHDPWGIIQRNILIKP